jgi:hypothetical protein
MRLTIILLIILISSCTRVIPTGNSATIVEIGMCERHFTSSDVCVVKLSNGMILSLYSPVMLGQKVCKYMDNWNKCN